MVYGYKDEDTPKSADLSKEKIQRSKISDRFFEDFYKRFFLENRKIDIDCNDEWT